MSLHFQSICSSSSGNCLALWSDTASLLIDCGLSSLTKTRNVLKNLYNRVDSILITHNHGDHISYYPLKAIEECGAKIHLHEDCVDQLREKHFNGHGFQNLKVHPFKNKTFTIRDFYVRPFRVIHSRDYPTCGYQLECQDKKVVIVTDFRQWQSSIDYFIDADFIFVESNHDLDLLKKYYNPNSLYHMPNTSTAELLVQVCRNSKKQLQTVVLGHLSSQRNTPEIALKETKEAFRKAGKDMNFELKTAPLLRAGEIILIN